MNKSNQENTSIDENKVNVFLFNIDDFPVKYLEREVSSFPLKISDYVNRYKLIEDRKSRLIARLIIKKYVLLKKKQWDWHHWNISEFNKPYLKNGPCFSISHSGKFVIVAFCEQFEIGIDIEEIKEIDIKAVSSYLHIEEIKYLNNNNYKMELFYNIWTRKEAFLKANGSGIVSGIDKISVLDDKIYQKYKWNIKQLDIHPRYKCAICSRYKINNLLIKKINLESLLH